VDELSRTSSQLLVLHASLASLCPTDRQLLEMGTPSAGSTDAAASRPYSNSDTSSAAVTAQDLVHAFKNNGSFDAVRNEILKSFTASVRIDHKRLRLLHPKS